MNDELTNGQKIAVEKRAVVERAKLTWEKIVDKEDLVNTAYHYLRFMSRLDDLLSRNGLTDEPVEISSCVVGIHPDAWIGDGLGEEVQAELLVGDEIDKKPLSSGRDGDGLHKRILGARKLTKVRSGLIFKIGKIKIVVVDEEPDEKVKVGLERYHGCLVLSARQLN